MVDQSELQKLHHCLRIIENIKKQIGAEEAARYVEKAIDLTRQWLNDKTDVSQSCMIFQMMKNAVLHCIRNLKKMSI